MALEDIGVATYHMSAGFDDINLLPVNPGLLEFFGRAQNGGTTEYVEDTLEVKYDVVLGDVERSKYLSRSADGGFNVGDNALIRKAGLFTTRSNVFPEILEKGAISYSQLFSRIPNERPADGFTKAVRMRWYANNLYGKMIQNIYHTYVVKGWESIRTGEVTLDDGSGDKYVWGRNAGNNAAAGAVWTNAATDILTDIDTRGDKVLENGKVDIDFMIPGIATWAGMKKNTQLTSEADNRGYMFIRAGSREALPSLPASLQFLIDAGLKYQAWIQTPAGRQIYVLTCNERVKDPSTGSFVKLMPDDEVIFGWSGARCDWKFGPSTFWRNENDEMETASRMGIDMSMVDLGMESVTRANRLDSRMFHIRTKPTGNVTYFEMMSSPLLITAHANAFARLTGTA